MFADFVEKHSERYRTRQQNDQFSSAQPLPVASDG
jgi:LysR family L-lactate utilization transcriptional regulator